MNLIFDLDGTLIDSSVGIYRAYKESIQNYQEPLEKKYFINHIGPPIQKIIRILHPTLENNKVMNIRNNFRKLYDNQYFLEFNTYENIIYQIQKLAQKNNCYIVTNKPIEPTKTIINKLELDDKFLDIIGIDSFVSSGQDKSSNILFLRNKYLLDISNTFYIGDTYSDYLSAKKNNIDFIAFAKGYHQWTNYELKEIKYIYNNTDELISILENLNSQTR
ncbi:hypothetical protein B0W81_01500 [Prochlorococcus sp. HOT_208_60]|nr:hypothetical protein B0W81_01500 [Prochlorococcus sp. HOT_208_60]